MQNLVLKLYIAGETSASKKSIEKLRTILTDGLGKNYDLLIIDILKHPEMAEKDKIMAAPTLLKRLPPPAQKIIGNLTSKDKVLLGLNLYPPSRKSTVKI